MEDDRKKEIVSNDRLLGAIDANVNRLVDEIKEVKRTHVDEFREARQAHTQAMKDIVAHLEKHFAEDDKRFGDINVEMKDVWKYINKGLGMVALIIILLGVLGWIVPSIMSRIGAARNGQNPYRPQAMDSSSESHSNAISTVDFDHTCNDLARIRRGAICL